jgi:hypothetical protein
MCECGCTSNDMRYLFPAPGNKVYMLTLSRGCVDCDGPAGVTIERLSKSDIHYTQREDYTDGELKFEKWAYSEGVAIITGFLKHEFVKKLSPLLVGTNIEAADEIDAEVLLEELYDASVMKPQLVEPSKATGSDTP